VQGVDDVFAILLALASKEEELEITLISVTFGNIDVRKYAQLSSELVLQRLTPFIAAYGTL
jgi:inosine-uridine nucleoside N-ribohydrolase